MQTTLKYTRLSTRELSQCKFVDKIKL